MKLKHLVVNEPTGKGFFGIFAGPFKLCLKALAARKHIGYQSLLRRFVAERVYEEEKREGMLK